MKQPTALAISKINKPGRYAVGNGAYLQVTGDTGRSWIFRYRDRRTGKARHMGMGPCDLVTLAEARDKARGYRKLLLDGIDPIEHRKAAHQSAVRTAARFLTFKQATEQYLAAHEPAWQSQEQGRSWRRTLAAHAFPVFGDLPVSAIDADLVLKAVQPIWAAKHVTATRVRNRIELILDFATVGKHREGENPARWRGHLEHALAKPAKVHRVQHLAALPYAEIPGFMAKVRKLDTLNARALEFIVLTAVRLSEAAGARWDEVAGGVWTVPPERMKSKREHRVPLSDAALACLARLPSEGRKFVFESRADRPFYGKILARETLPSIRAGITVHGFRSTFRDWAAEQTNHPREIAEAALAHVVGDKTEAAYQRGDLLERRRRLMNDWAAFCAGSQYG